MSEKKPKIDDRDAYPAVLQKAANVRLSDSAVYIAYWRTDGLQIDFPAEDEARQGWYCENAGALLATCPAVEPIEPVKA